MEDYKKKDIASILAYMAGKDAVEVADIIAESGAEDLRVYSIIAQLHSEGILEILETEEMGAPKMVRLV